MAGRRWTEEEIELLDELRSIYTVETIAKQLGRTYSAVNLKLCRMGMPSFRGSTDLLTQNQVCLMLGIDYKKVKRWRTMGLRPRRKGGFVTFQQANVLKFLKEHPEEWNAAKVTDDTLLAHYDWYRAKKQTDTARAYFWRPDEESRLKALYRKGATEKEIAQALGRSVYSIKNKLHYLRTEKGFKI